MVMVVVAVMGLCSWLWEWGYGRGNGVEGIAVGCAMYGLQRLREREQFEKKNNDKKNSKVMNLTDDNNNVAAAAASGGTASSSSSSSASGASFASSDVVVGPPDVVSFQQSPFSAYQGKEFDAEELEDILVDWLPWITHTKHTTQQSLVDAAVERIANGEVVGWFQGRSEFGQRALGSRSILADPRNTDVRRFVNEKVKEREWYRPLAPSGKQ